MTTVEPAPVRGLQIWRSPAGAVAAGVLLAQLVWRGYYLLNGFYTQDDFKMIQLGLGPLNGDLLFQDYAGHFWPGTFLIAWVTAHLAGPSWTLTAFSLLAMQLVAGALMWVVLSRLVGSRWVRVPVLAVFAFSPLTLWSVQWWAQAIGYLPVAICLLGAVWAVLRRIQDGALWGSPLAVVLTGFALMFQERGLLVPVVLAGVALMLGDVPGVWRRLWTTLSAYRWLWLSLAVSNVGFVLLHRQMAPVKGTTTIGPGETLRLVANFVGRTLAPGIFGGPWQGEVTSGALLVPSAWAVVVGAGALAALVGWSAWVGGSVARWSWALLVLYVLLDIALLFAGRSQYGAAFGLLPRYVADVVPVLCITLGGVARGVRLPHRLRKPALAALVLTLGYAGSAAVSTVMMAPYQYHEEDRAFVETLRSELRAQPRAVLYDGLVPDAIMINWFGPDRKVSTVLAAAPENPVFDVPTPRLLMADDEGRLREVTLTLATQMKPADFTDCGYPVSGGPTAVPLQSQVDVDRAVLRIGYYTNTRLLMDVETGGTSQSVPVRPGLNGVDLVVSGSFDEVTLSLEGDPATVCVASLEVGYPAPAEP